MSLPQIKHPIFDATLPVSGEKIKYRPFLVSEEKLLLMAAQTKTPGDIAKTVKQILNNCILNPDFNVGKMNSVDAEYLFVKLRSVSVNNVLELRFKDHEDEKSYPVEIDLEDLEVTTYPEHTNTIDLDGNVFIEMQLPTLDQIIGLLERNVDLEKEDNYALVRTCITQVYDKEQVYDIKDMKREEWDAWITTFPLEAKQRVQNFFESAPALVYTHKYKNSLGNERTLVLRGLTDFFQFA